MYSDYAYLDVGICLMCCLLFVLHRISVTDGLSGLKARALNRVELKGVSVIMLLISMVSMIVYGFVMANIKYREGFWVDQVTGLIITRPASRYDDRDRSLLPAISALLYLGLTLQCSAMFLVIALWNHMSKAMLHKQFMSSIEFKGYAIFSMVNLATHPFLQIWYYLTRDPLVSRIVPLFIYSFQCFLLVVLIFVANIRFRKLIQQLPVTTQALSRIIYYSRMNTYLLIAVGLTFLGQMSICIDSVTTDSLSYNKLILDVITKIMFFGFVMTYPVLIMILCPPAMSTQLPPVSLTSSKMRRSQLVLNSPPAVRNHRSTRSPASDNAKAYRKEAKNSETGVHADSEQNSIKIGGESARETPAADSAKNFK